MRASGSDRLVNEAPFDTNGARGFYWSLMKRYRRRVVGMTVLMVLFALLAPVQGALSDRSWSGWVRRGAVIGLGRTFHRQALNPLMARLTDNAEVPLVRRSAASALAGLARELDRATRRRVMEALIDTLSVPDHATRSAAVSALGLLGDRRAIAAIESTRGATAGQFHPAIERTVRKLRRTGSGGEVSRLRTQVEELTDRLRKMEHRLQDLEVDKRSASD